VSYHLITEWCNRCWSKQIFYSCACSIIMKIKTTLVVSEFMKRVIQVCCLLLIFTLWNRPPGRPVPKRRWTGWPKPTTGRPNGRPVSMLKDALYIHYDVKQCLHVGSAWRYSTASLALARPWLSYSLWMTVFCTAVLDLGYHPGSWPGSKISYRIAICNPTLALACVT